MLYALCSKIYMLANDMYAGNGKLLDDETETKWRCTVWGSMNG